MYKANKPCRFGEKQFYVGDEIPAELIDENRVKTLVKYGTILSVPDLPPKPSETETGTNTSTAPENSSEGDKQAFNEAKPAAAQKPEQKNRQQAKPPVKKGGK